MAFPNVGQNVASMQVSQAPTPKVPRRISTPTFQHNMTLGPQRKFLGGGGMAVGPLRTPQGHPKHPKAARTALLAAMHD